LISSKMINWFYHWIQ